MTYLGEIPEVKRKKKLFDDLHCIVDSFTFAVVALLWCKARSKSRTLTWMTWTILNWTKPYHTAHRKQVLIVPSTGTGPWYSWFRATERKNMTHIFFDFIYRLILKEVYLWNTFGFPPSQVTRSHIKTTSATFLKPLRRSLNRGPPGWQT